MKADFLVTVILVLLTGAAYAAEKEAPADEKEIQSESYIYDHRGKRDPLVPLVGLTSGKIESLDDIMSIDDVILQGIAIDSTGRKTVIVNGEMVKEGGGGGRLIVKKILKNEVILVIDNEEHRLSIYEEEAK